MNIDMIRKLQQMARNKEAIPDKDLQEALAFLREDRTLKPKATKATKTKAAKPQLSLDDLMGDLS